MKTTTLLFMLIVSFSIVAFSQQHPEVKRTWHWYFGWNAGLDFSSGTIQEDLDGQVDIDEGACSISDTAGNLLFYAGPNGGTLPGENNMTVYNANHEVMQNGTDIDCGWSGRQNSIIVPLPESDNIYYLFTIGHYSEPYETQLGFKYNIIDMSLDEGMGAVTQKNIEICPSPTYDTFSEILTAVHHANCKDIWIMIHRFNADEFLVYKLTENGLDAEPVVNNIGYHTSNCIGWGMKFSPNGKYAAVNKSYMWLSLNEQIDTLELYKFDNETGVLSDRIAIPMDSSLCGKEFSFQNDLLYTFEIHEYELNVGPSIFQYDISKWQEFYIMGSKTLIGNYSFPIPDLHLTPLNTIIIGGDLRENIGVIEHPDVLGIGCSVNENALTITNNTAWNFPNFVRSYFNTDSTAYNCNQVSVDDVISNQTFEVYPNPFAKQAEIKTYNREIIYYNLYDLKGNQMTQNNDYKLRKTDDAYVFVNKKLNGGIYILSGVFADKEQFNIKLSVNN
ncbi:MAG TPA: hypothetical protein PKN32_06970 [Bacteroidales bacterium]|nr:hypothetical protein [Bacteroidales bacterium]